MAINAQRRSLFEQMIDLVEIKAGLLLPQAKAITLLNKEADYEGWWNEDLDSFIRIHFEDYEESFLQLMTVVGGLPDTTSPIDCVVKYIKEIGNKVGIQSQDLMAEYRLVMDIQKSFMELEIADTPVPERLSSLPDFSRFQNEYLSRNLYHSSPPRS